ncbi:MAG: hypothetical protein R3E95_01880 [Thiolinea sp.]
MLDLVVNFLIGLVIIGIPSYAFYKIGIDAGIQRGIRRQILHELTLSGVIEKVDARKRQRQAPH